MTPMLFTLTGLLFIATLAAFIAARRSRRHIGIGFSLIYLLERVTKQERSATHLAWIVAIGALILGAAILAGAPRGFSA
jgi:hypothetical protein